MQLYLIRHAQTDYNKEFRIQGSRIDSELSLHGEEQTKKIAERLKNTDFDLILCSPLKRTRKTLEMILQKNYNSNVVFEGNLQERDWGSMSGELWEKVDFENLPVDAEKKPDFVRRIVETFEKYYAENQDSKVLIVTHGGVIRSLIEEFFPETDLRAPDVSLTVFKFCINGNHRMILEPCTAHLD